WAHIGAGDTNTFAVGHWWPWGDSGASNPIPPNPALGTPVKMYICPSEPRNLTVQYEAFGNFPSTPISFTEYLGVDGIQGQDVNGATWPAGDKSGILVNSGWDGVRRINIASITDGTTNTLMVGERPPSADMFYGWWFAGGG